MKKTLIYLCVLVAFASQSCKKAYSPGDNYDFSTSLPAYVTITNKAVSVDPPAVSGNVAVNVRTAFQQAITVTYSVSGIVTASNQTATIAKEAYSVNIPIARPTTGTTTGVAKVTIIKAALADGTALIIGQNNVAADQVATVTFN